MTWTAMRRLGAMEPYHLQDGDNLSSLGRRRGVTWRWLYEHPLNEELRRQRPNPNLILVGDLVFIPTESRNPAGTG